MDERTAVAIVTAFNGGCAILFISAVAWLFSLPLIFAPLAPTAFVMFATPFSSAAAPRSVIFGHTLAIFSGAVLWHVISSLTGQPISIDSPSFALCISGSLCFMLTGAAMVRLQAVHPSACATAVIVATGAVTGLGHLLILELTVILLTAQAILVDRILEVHAPLWRIDPLHDVVTHEYTGEDRREWNRSA